MHTFEDISMMEAVTKRTEKSINPLNPPPYFFMDLKDIGNLIKSLRKLRGWTQSDLAEKSEIPFRTIQNLEYGQNVGLSVFLSVMNALKYELFVKTTEGEDESIEK